MKKKRLDDFPHRGRWSQILLRMKLTFVLVFCMLVQTFAAVNAQTVTLKKQNASLEEIIWELKEQTKFVFLYSSADIATVKGIDIDMQNSQIDAILKKCLEGTDLQFVKENNAIIIRQANGKTAVPQVQSRKITGKVIDEDGNPLPGVAVLIEGTTIGVATDMDGKYDLTCPEMKDIVLKFSYIGMKPKSVVVGNKTVVDVTLESDSQEMDEVVVTGLLNRRKSGFAGTTTVISKQELAKVSTGNIFTTISTLDAGFKIEENNLDGSNPNKLPDFTIRGKGSFQNGSTAPIFILDGFEVTSQKVFDMDINRIESITLLKDASATILYGSRASNGVIVIETTAPKAGKLRVTYDFKPTIAIVDLTDYDLMNAREKLQYEKEAGLYTQEITPGYEDNDRREQVELDKAYYNRYKNIVEGVNTYWLSQPVKNAFSHAHSLFVEGGADNVRYGIDASYNQNKGVMKESGRDRFGLGFSLIYRIKDKITIKNYISYAHTHAYNSPYGSFSQYAKLNPYERIYNDNGELIPKLSDGDTNPLYDALLPNRNFTKDQEFREQLSVDWFICDGLRLKGQMAIVKGETSGEIYKSPFSAEFLKTTYNSESRVQEYLPIAERGYLSMTDGASFSYDGNVTLNYNTLVNEKHIIYAGAGLEVTQNDNNSHGFIMTGFPDDRYSDPAFAIQYKKETKPSSSESKSRAIGFFANGNYSYDDRYFADVSVRIDGSSKFGADKKYAPFWSAGAGWNVHNEKFFKHTKISMLKLRYSYGVTGNQEFSAYQAKTMFQFNTDRLYNSGISAALMGYGNPDLEWQNQYQSNYGFDFGYAKDRIRLQFNYYQKKTEGMLTSVSVAPSLGLPSNTFTSNLGKIQNKGIEVNLNAVLIRDQGKDFEWSVMLQAAHNKNKIMEISTALKNINEKNNQDKTTPAAVYEEGESMSAIKAVPSLGIDPTTGQELFMKKDGTITYTWDATDKVICGDSEPKVFGNVGTNLYWKGWNLNMVFKYDLGADYYNSTLAERVEGANPRYNADRRVLNNRWKEPGQHALYKNIKEYTTTYISSRFVQKENTLQLTSLSLSYDLNREWIRKFGLNTMRLSFYMNDVFRASTVKNERGLDYPFQRSFVFGLNIGF
jgi:TonB-linked SusC/RagA family outer membrane protein